MKKILFTGSYAKEGEKGISRLEFDTDTCSFAEIYNDTTAYCPSYVLKHPEKDILYAVRELTSEGALYAFRIHEDSLELLCKLPTLGMDPCFISLDAGCRFLAVTNYSGSSFSVFKLDDDGVPQEMVCHIKHEGSGPVEGRQEAAHPHCAVYHQGLLYVCDLGMDRIFVYEQDRESGVLSEKNRIELPAGAGPRHLLFPVDKDNLMYAVGELASSVYVFELYGANASLIQHISALPDGNAPANISAAIRQSEDGRAIFVSNRGHDSMAIFQVKEDGRLTSKGWCSCQGKTPRDFQVAGNYLIVANQDSDCLTTLQFDPETYELRSAEGSYECIKPTCIAFA